MKLKYRFLMAVIKGELISEQTALGRIITLKHFTSHFLDMNSSYMFSFLPASTIEAGIGQVSRTKFVRRIRKGIYLIPNEVIEAFKEEFDKGKPD